MMTTPLLLLRCGVVHGAATAGLAAAASLALPAARAVGPEQRFDQLLVSGSGIALLATAAWLWLVTTLLVAEVLRGTGCRDRRGVPPLVRRVVLAACGAALVAPAAPAAADPAAGTGDRRGDVSVLHGLPVPARATSSASEVAPGTDSRTDSRTDSGAAPPPPSSGRTTVVRAGDTLWGLAATDLPPHAAPAAVARRWQRVHDLNRAVIGDDPDLIHPGQQLRLPPAAHRGEQP